MSIRLTAADPDIDAYVEAVQAGMTRDVWPRTFVCVELVHDSVDIIISDLLNAPGTDVHVFERGTRREESWLTDEEWFED